MKDRSPEAARRREQRRAATATMAKCSCGNVLGLDRVQANIPSCRGCLPDEELDRRQQASKMRKEVGLVECPHTRRVLNFLLDNIH